MSAEPLTGPCDECGSLFLGSATGMAGLCAECAHKLYNYPPCIHAMKDGRCVSCGWDGSVSAFLKKGGDPDSFGAD